MTELEGKIRELSKLIHGWNLIKVDSKSQLNDFSMKLLNSLIKEKSEEKNRRIVESELTVTYGLYRNEFDAMELTKQLMHWAG